MAYRTWGRVLLTALGVALLAGAGQLGLAYGLGIVRFARDFESVPGHWPAQLAWVAWFAMTAAIVGALAADRLARNEGYTAGTGSRIAYAVAAGLGACAVAPLSMLPAQGSTVPGVSPVTIAGLSAMLGAVGGVFAALGVLAVRTLGWNVAAVTELVWLLALISVAPSLGPDDPLPEVRLGVLDPSWLGDGTAQRLAVMVMPAIALAAGAGVGVLARWRNHPVVAVAASGAVGPAMLALAYLIAGPGSGDRYQSAPYWGAIISVGAGALGSVLAAVAQQLGAAKDELLRGRGRKPSHGMRDHTAEVFPAYGDDPTLAPWERRPDRERESATATAVLAGPGSDVGPGSGSASGSASGSDSDSDSDEFRVDFDAEDYRRRERSVSTPDDEDDDEFDDDDPLGDRGRFGAAAGGPAGRRWDSGPSTSTFGDDRLSERRPADDVWPRPAPRAPEKHDDEPRSASTLDLDDGPEDPNAPPPGLGNRPGDDVRTQQSGPVAGRRPEPLFTTPPAPQRPEARGARPVPPPPPQAAPPPLAPPVVPPVVPPRDWRRDQTDLFPAAPGGERPGAEPPRGDRSGAEPPRGGRSPGADWRMTDTDGAGAEPTRGERPGAEPTRGERPAAASESGRGGRSPGADWRLTDTDGGGAEPTPGGRPGAEPTRGGRSPGADWRLTDTDGGGTAPTPGGRPGAEPTPGGRPGAEPPRGGRSPGADWRLTDTDGGGTAPTPGGRPGAEPTRGERPVAASESARGGRSPGADWRLTDTDGDGADPKRGERPRGAEWPPSGGTGAARGGRSGDEPSRAAQWPPSGGDEPARGPDWRVTDTARSDERDADREPTSGEMPDWRLAPPAWAEPDEEPPPTREKRRGLFGRKRASKAEAPAPPPPPPLAAPAPPPPPVAEAPPVEEEEDVAPPPSQQQPTEPQPKRRAGKKAKRDEEYVDWVAGLSAPDAEERPRDAAPRRSLRSGRHSTDTE